MAKTIAINAGSSSLKWQLYDMPHESVLAKGLIERIGLKDAIATVKYNGKEVSQTLTIADHTQAVKRLLEDLKSYRLISDFHEITGIGHRVVAGGEDFKESVVLDEAAIQKIEALSELAPLHNPANVAGIRAFKELLPDVHSVAVFDTAFHTTMQPATYLYPIKTRYYDAYKVRKYGAHGTSHYYVAHEAAKYLSKPLEALKLITAHIGNGISITANRHGKSVDTSMGFTPLAGVMMGTRSGDIDPAIVSYLLEKDPNLETASDVVNVLNRESGLLGVSGISSDMRDIKAARDKGDTRAALAFEMFVDRIRKYIAQYLAVLNGADAIVFTAGIGENDAEVRKSVVDGLSWFGCQIDPEKNSVGARGEISTADSRLKVLVIPTDEELVIARDVERLKG